MYVKQFIYLAGLVDVAYTCMAKMMMFMYTHVLAINDDNFGVVYKRMCSING